ncbi:hypothetical protein K525DRAFT_241751 [Schizophyllum commune Loenen D]|nr:hypothetical protein K525DRAFT_241751 [Schizophyllum commune Loenen D]
MGRTAFESFRAMQNDRGLPPFAPFRSMEEWEHLQWLVTSGASQSKIDEYLKLKSIRAMGFSFHNKRSFLQFIDKLPQAPAWSCRSWSVEGNIMDKNGNPMTEDIELWQRDPVECIRDLLGNPAYNGHQGYAPYRVFRGLDQDGNGVNREYDEMWTGDWWYDTQVSCHDTHINTGSPRTQAQTSGRRHNLPSHSCVGQDTVVSV